MFVKVGYFKVRICYCLPSVFPAPLYQILVIYLLRHDGCRAFHPQVSPSFVRERTHISLFFRRQCDDTFASVWYFSIRNFNCGKRLDTPDRVRYIPLGFVAHVLSDDFSLVGDTEQYRAAFAVKEGVSMPRSNCPVVSLNSTRPHSFSAINRFIMSRLSMLIYNSVTWVQR